MLISAHMCIIESSSGLSVPSLVQQSEWEQVDSRDFDLSLLPSKATQVDANKRIYAHTWRCAVVRRATRLIKPHSLLTTSDTAISPTEFPFTCETPDMHLHKFDGLSCPTWARFERRYIVLEFEEHTALSFANQVVDATVFYR